MTRYVIPRLRLDLRKCLPNHLSVFCDQLKRLLVVPPPPHAPTQICDFTEQKAVTRAWSLATAYLTWEARPDLSASTIEATLHPLADHLTCDQCRAMLLDRIREVVVQWSMVKVRISCLIGLSFVRLMAIM